MLNLYTSCRTIVFEQTHPTNSTLDQIYVGRCSTFIQPPVWATTSSGTTASSRATAHLLVSYISLSLLHQEFSYSIDSYHRHCFDVGGFCCAWLIVRTTPLIQFVGPWIYTCTNIILNLTTFGLQVWNFIWKGPCSILRDISHLLIPCWTFTLLIWKNGIWANY